MSKSTINTGKLRDLTTTDLTASLATVRDELFRLKLGMQTNQVTSTASVGTKRREIARIMTILNGRKHGLEQSVGQQAEAAPVAAKVAPKAKKSTKAKAE